MKSAFRKFSDLPEEDGRLAALMFLQTIADHGSALTGKEAGSILIDAFADVAERASHDNEDDRAARIEGFVSYLGEALWWHASDRVLNREQTAKVILDAIRVGFRGDTSKNGGS